MKIEEFKSLLKCAKYTHKMNAPNLRLQREENKNIVYIKYKNKCKCCNHEIIRKVKIVFKQPQPNITIAESEILYFLIAENKKKAEYNGFHNCIAGKKFIENIDNIEMTT